MSESVRENSGVLIATPRRVNAVKTVTCADGDWIGQNSLLYFVTSNKSSLGPMQLARLETRDASAMAELWLAGAAESGATDPSFLPRQTLAECAASIEADLANKVYFGWGVFEASTRGLLAYLTARIEEPSKAFQRDASLYLLDLDVKRLARRQGFGTGLVAAAKRYAEERSIERVEVGWLAADPQASAFWLAQGFCPYLARAQVCITRSPHGASPR